MLRLITGPNDSGKSAFAEALFERIPGPKRYLATLPDLAQHAERIERHRARRPPEWIVHELSADLRDDLPYFRACADERSCVLLDGFSIYLRRLILFDSERRAATLVNRMSKSILYLGAVCPEVIVVDCPAGKTEEGSSTLLRASADIAAAAGELTVFDADGLRDVVSRGEHGPR